MNHRLKSILLRSLPAVARRTIMARRYDREVSVSGEAELMEIRKLVAPGDLCLDIGCNLGVYTYEMSRAGGRVIAFEPNPELVRLVASLKLDRVEVRQVALSSSNGEAELLVPKDGGGHGLASLRSEAVAGLELERIRVPTQRLDDINLPKIAFIKLDVEGFEEEVLAGARKTIERDRPKLLIEIEERHNAGGLERIVKSLKEIGYSGRYLRSGWQSVETFDITKDQPVGAELAEVGVSIPRREFAYINNFLFEPND